jgi:hypothetical protein
MRWARQVAGQAFGELGPASARARTPARRAGLTPAALRKPPRAASG